MVEIQNLSKIGFGGYRLDREDNEHYHTLIHALQSGCNLIDTASNYTNGRSELLIGHALRCFKSDQPFLITKAGYILESELNDYATLLRDSHIESDLIPFEDGSGFSIHPLVLDDRIARSATRLGRKCIDTFLLHNPEYLYNHKETETNPQYPYLRIREAFNFLEHQITLGRLRYYGISSNTFALPPTNPNTLDLRVLISIANEISTSHHFRFIQFPFNFLESHALNNTYGHTNIINIAKSYSLQIITNRPFNAKSSDGGTRILTGACIEPIDALAQTLLLEECKTIINEQIRITNVENDPANIQLLAFLTTNTFSFPSEESCNELYYRYIFPWLKMIFGGVIAHSYGTKFKALFGMSLQCSRNNQIMKSEEYKTYLLNNGYLACNNVKPLSLQACEYYLQKGIDHVLVGMNKRSFVNELKPLFSLKANN